MGRPKKIMRLGDLMPKEAEKPWKDQRDEDVQQRIPIVRVTGKTKNHQAYLKAIDTSVVTIVTSRAGTGKSWMACGRAIEMLLAGKVKRIVVTRPMVQCDEELGILPGDVNDKTGPYIQPLMDAFGDFIGAKELAKLCEAGIIETVPLAFMRGRSFKDAFIILDEAQNATYSQLRMFLTRFGLNSKVVINGDISQSDLKIGRCPLLDVIDNFKHQPDFSKKPISIVTMGDPADIMRHPFLQWIDEALLSPNKQESSIHPPISCVSIHCPSCKETLWFEDRLDIEFISCWQCLGTIEIVDEDGNDIDPRLDGTGFAGTPAETFPVEP